MADAKIIIRLVINFVQGVPTACFLLKFLVPGINEYLAGWFHMKLCAKFTLHSCYRLFLH